MLKYSGYNTQGSWSPILKVFAPFFCIGLRQQTKGNIMLTQEQIKQRSLGIGGTDAKKIMDGEDNWHSLWMEKTGRKQPEDLSLIFQVQLGLITEEFNLHWLEQDTGWEIVPYAKAFTSKEYPFMRCHPDAIAHIDDGHAYSAVVDAKHTNAFTDAEELYERYYYQLLHNFIVMKTCGELTFSTKSWHKTLTHCVISVIRGNQWLQPIIFEPDKAEIEKLIDYETTFWQYVIDDKEPTMGQPYKSVPSVALNKMIEGDMEAKGDNEWAAFAKDWLETKDAKKQNMQADKILKKKLADNVRLAYGNGVQIKRSRQNKLYLTEQKVKQQEQWR